MKTTIQSIFVTAALLAVFTSANAQRFVVVKPPHPHAVIIGRHLTPPPPERIWVEGFWKWNRMYHNYVWVSGHWMYPNPRRHWRH